MKEKEKRLGFETPLKFIFSHSALKEGWDNPNVFQICTLREMGTERERRQTIGRGLRLCVNQDGQRLRGFEVNTLTVIATENYEQFAQNLQKEIEADTGIRFGIVEYHQFAAIAVTRIELVGETINRCKRLALVDGIKYQRLGDEYYYVQELFELEELTGYLKNMLMDTTKSVYEHVVYDSNTERDFADALEKNDAIKVYAKLPAWFKVPTPLGSYNPDWAVLVEQDGEERLYFIVETKSSLFTDDLRDREGAKIECGKAHFQALAIVESPAKYVVARSVDDVLKKAHGAAT
ncbi:MAG: restriction endonuclease subunit R, partial [Nitrosospira sp.]|nr:restriction endonuclease subunit R [Nitrosospira sp.]